MASFVLGQDVIQSESLSKALTKVGTHPPLAQHNSLPPIMTPTLVKKDPPAKRHYKKDSRFVNDLYTLTFDEGETVDDIETTCKNMDGAPLPDQEFLSLAPSTISSMTLDSGSGPMSLGSNYSSSNGTQQQHAAGPVFLSSGAQSLMPMTRPGAMAVGQPGPMVVQAAALPSLETNLHKILARKIQDSEEVSFRKAKLLTKAYYKLLRESTPAQPEATSKQQRPQPQPPRVGDASLRLSWQTLLRTDPVELKRIVSGLGNTVKALNDYLMDLLEERDEQLGQQDNMLEEISEMTDQLL